MKADRAVATRWSRVAVLGSIVIGWALIAFGLAAGAPPLGVAGAIIVGVGNLVLAKSLLELRTATSFLKGSSIQTDRAVARAYTDIEGLRSMDEQLRSADATQDEALDRLQANAISLEERFATLLVDIERARSADSEAQSQAVAEVRSRVEKLRSHVETVSSAHEVTRMALSATRAMTNKLASRARINHGDPRLLAVSTNEVDSPLLSIGIPSFERPSALAELLASIEQEMEACPSGLVEVCIVDDASADPEVVEIALDFAEQNRFASLVVRPKNIGLERNLIGAARPCRGEYLLVVGNDDVLVPGALPLILADLEAGLAPVLLYAKGRINLDGTPHDPVPGTTPIDLEENGTHVFDTLVDAARRQGLLSTFGFSGQIVTPRARFVATDPTPYLDLTMYSRSFVTIAAFFDQPVFYRNRPTILHRTPKPAEKHSESLGRPEEEFMAAGLRRRARYLGTALAAALQRLVDHGALTVTDLVEMPEQLMTPLPLVEWISNNRRIDPEIDDRLEGAVVADAVRLFTSIDRASMARVDRP